MCQDSPDWRSSKFPKLRYCVALDLEMELLVIALLLQLAFAVPFDTDCDLPRIGTACDSWKPGWPLRIIVPETLPCNFTLFTNVDHQTVLYIIDYFDPYDQHCPYPYSVFAAEKKRTPIQFSLIDGKLATTINLTKGGAENNFRNTGCMVRTTPLSRNLFDCDPRSRRRTLESRIWLNPSLWRLSAWVGRWLVF